MTVVDCFELKPFRLSRGLTVNCYVEHIMLKLEYSSLTCEVSDWHIRVSYDLRKWRGLVCCVSSKIRRTKSGFLSLVWHLYRSATSRIAVIYDRMVHAVCAILRSNASSCLRARSIPSQHHIAPAAPLIFQAYQAFAMPVPTKLRRHPPRASTQWIGQPF